MDHRGTARKNRCNLKHHNSDKELKLSDYLVEIDLIEQTTIQGEEEEESEEPVHSGTMTCSGRVSKLSERFGW